MDHSYLNPSQPHTGDLKYVYCNKLTCICMPFINNTTNPDYPLVQAHKTVIRRSYPRSQVNVWDITKYLKFTNDNYDMGKIPNGKPVEYNVDVQNISNSNITLDNVIVGCGCTTPKYTKNQVLTFCF
jgi:hypothetical protein